MPPNDAAGVHTIDVPASEVLKSDVSLPLEPTLLTPAQRMLREIQDMTIDAPVMYDIAAGELGKIKGAYNRLEEERLSLTRPLDEVKKKIMARFSKPLETLKAAEDALKSKMLTYREAQERKAAEERRRQEELARAERERLAKEAEEIERKAREEAAIAKKKADEEAAALAAAGREKEAAEARARAEAEAREKREQAEQEAAARRETAAIVVAAPAATEVPATKGTSVRKVWKHRVVDKAALIKHVAQFPQFENLLEVNEGGLNALARALKGNLNMPGVESYEEAVMASRAS